MAESEMAKKITKAIKAVDKFVEDMKKDGNKIKEALEELKGSDKGQGEEDI